jgi:hypothetical protein
MADEEQQARERSRSAQPSEDSDNEGDVDGAAKREDAKVTSKLYATLLVLLGIILYVYVLYIVLANLLYPCSLAPFLETRNTSASTRNTLRARLDNDAICGLRHAILNNAALLLLFVAQHSLMACKPLKDLWANLGLSAISRLIYVFSTCCTIQFTYHFWQSTPSHTLWECNSTILVLSLKAIHTLCWFSVACSLFTIDYLELLGIKQIYYSYNGFGDPLHYKSAEQQYLLQHMRHPIFTAPLLIMWSVPVMPYDRLLLAIMLPLYMAWASGINSLDMTYVKRQFVSKWQQLLLQRK